MSIINSDGLNTNWQLNVLRGLQGVIDELKLQANDTTIIAPKGQEDMDASIPVVLASNQSAIPTNSTIVGPLDARIALESVSVVLATNQANLEVGARIIISSGEALTSINVNVYSISFASNGSVPAIITFDGGSTLVAIPEGTTINMDAGGVCNFYSKNKFGYDTDTNPGSSLIITYNEVL
jgi:hypothetical protein